jgi:hypothetical protein
MSSLLPLLLALSARPQDVASGPEKGARVPALKVFDATGAHKGKEVDYAEAQQAKPTVYVFVRADAWGRPMARFLRQLDEAAQKEEGAAVVAVWLTAEQEKTKDYLPAAQQSLQLKATALTCFPGEPAGPKDWGVNPDAHATVVVAAGGKVAATFGYRSVNETDAPAVRDALKKAAQRK